MSLDTERQTLEDERLAISVKETLTDEDKGRLRTLNDQLDFSTTPSQIILSPEMPCIPSELLEPQLTKFFGLMISFIGSEREFPSKKKWQEWHFMFKGVHYLVMGNRSRDEPTGLHANLAYGNMLHQLDPCWATRDEWDEKRAKDIWETCRKVHLRQ